MAVAEAEAVAEWRIICGGGTMLSENKGKIENNMVYWPMFQDSEGSSCHPCVGGNWDSKWQNSVLSSGHAPPPDGRKSAG